MAGYRDLKAWQLAVELADEIYTLSEDWPNREQFGLTSQARRAAVSVPSNIAEGQGRLSKREFRHHLSIAFASLCELETLVHLARRRTFCDTAAESQFLTKSDEVARVLRGLMKSMAQD